jgi:hypothetical protein
MDINQSFHVKSVVDPEIDFLYSRIQGKRVNKYLACLSLKKLKYNLNFLKGYISIENKYKILVSKSYVK